MRELFIGMTLGYDPHTVGLHKASKVARQVGLAVEVLPPQLTNEEKIHVLLEKDPQYIGLSYRLSKDKAMEELTKMLTLLEQHGFFNDPKRKVCFAALYPTLDEVEKTSLVKTYPLTLIGSHKDIVLRTEQTLNFLDVEETSLREAVIDQMIREFKPEGIDLLDKLALEVIKDGDYLNEPERVKPTDAALNHFPVRMKETDLPLIRTHFGIPGDTIEPTVEGIKKLALHGAVDEVSLGSSDLSQRYFGDHSAFETMKNDGGVPYKDVADLKALYEASRMGNYPAVKPYAHVKDLVPFVDTCLEVGMLKGAHQAVPLFWFSELDGRGPLSVKEAIKEHKATVKYLAEQGLPVEMNDPNQWSSRFIHDTLFVVDYALIASVMYTAGVKDMIFQHQFNKPAETGDFADLAKMTAAKQVIEWVRPKGNTSQIYMEARSGIEHFSTDLDIAKVQLARTTLLQMMFNPDVFHLVSYCEAHHAATADDVIESSQLVRRAARLYHEHKEKLLPYFEHDVVKNRVDYLLEEARVVLVEIAKLSRHYREGMALSDLAMCLSDEEALTKAMELKIMTAPGIMHPDFKNPEMLTKPSRYGFIDVYKDWEDDVPLREKERLESLKISEQQ